MIASGRVPFCSVAMVLAFPHGVRGSNSARTMYFCDAFVPGLFSYEDQNQPTGSESIHFDTMFSFILYKKKTML